MNANTHIKAVSSALKFATNLQMMVQSALKVHDVTISQFQILTVLSSAHPLKLAVKDVRKNLPRRTTDFTRIVDRLESKSLVERFECPVDRRRSELILSKDGVELMKQLNIELKSLAEQVEGIMGLDHSDTTITKRTAS